MDPNLQIAEELRSAGFSEDEIAAHFQEEGVDLANPDPTEDTNYDPDVAAELTEAGFSEEEIAEHFKTETPDRLEEGESDIFDFNLDFFKADIPNEDQKLDSFESIQGSWNNMLDHIGLIDDRALNLIGTVFGNTDSEYFQKSEAEIRNVEENSAETLGFTDLPDTYKEEGFLGATGNMLAAITNSLTSLASSAAISAPTFGVGLALDMISTSIRDFNVEKAESNGTTIEELIASGQGEVIVPAIIGSVSYSFEKFGLKSIAKNIGKMPAGWKKQLVNIMNSSGKEGGTEFAQGIMEAVNLDLARHGNDLGKVGPEILRFLKEDALETTLQGMVGGGVSTGAGVPAKRALRAAKLSRSDEGNKVVNNGLSSIAELDRVIANEDITEEEREATQKVRDEIKTKVEEAVNQPYEAINTWNEEELAAVEKEGKKVLAIEDAMEQLQYLPEDVQKIQRANLEADIKKAKDVIQKTVKESEKRNKDLEKVDEKLEEAKKEAEKAPEEKKEAANKKVKELEAERKELEGTPMKEEETPAEKVKQEIIPTEEEQEDVDQITKLFGPQQSLEEQFETLPNLEQKQLDLEKELSDKLAEGVNINDAEAKSLLKEIHANERKVYAKKRDSFKASVAEQGATVEQTPQFKALENEAFNLAAVEHLQEQYPDQAIFNTEEGFQQGIKAAREAGQQIPAGLKGFVFEGKIYLNPKAVTKDTAFHEMSHIWANMVAKKDIQFFKRGIELLKGTTFMRRIADNPGYQALREKDLLKWYEEVMALALGEQAAIEFENQQQKSAWQKWVDQFTKKIKQILGIKSKNNYQDMTLNEWLEVGAKSILTGDQTITKGEFAGKKGTKQVDAQLAEDAFVEKKAGAIADRRLPEGTTEKDILNVVYNLRVTAKNEGNPLPRGWAKDPAYADQILAALETAVARRQKKEGRITKAKEAGGKIEAEVAPIDNATFQAAAKSFTKFLDGVNKRAWGQSALKFLYEKDAEGNPYITPEQVGIAIASLSHTIEDGINHATMFKALGKAFKRKNAPGEMDLEAFNKAKYHVGSGIMQFLEQEGKIETVWDYDYGGWAIKVKDQDFFDNMSDSAALFADNDQYASVFVGEYPPKDDIFREYFTRTHPGQNMTRENSPEVYKAIDNADSQKYEVDQAQMKNIEKMFELGLLFDESQDYSPEQKRSVERSIKSAIQEMKKVGEGQWFTQAHKLLHNGRVMTAAQGLNHQSAKFVLSAFSFNKKEKMGKQGLKWTQILATDTFGFSGADSLESRQKFFEDNKDKWLEIAKDPFGTQENIDYIMSADTPALFLRYITELSAAYEHPDGPENFESGLPNHMDATTSGIQFLAALSGDYNSAKIANITNDKQRYDSYMNIVKKVWDGMKTTFTPGEQKIVDKLKGLRAERNAERSERFEAIVKTAPEGKYDRNDPAWQEYSKKWKEFKKVNQSQKPIGTKAERDLESQVFWSDPKRLKKMRKIFKKPVMTKYYSAKEGGISASILEQFKDHKDFQGINLQYTRWLANHIVEAADQVFKGPGQIMSELIAIAEELTPQGKFVQYQHGDGFNAVNDPTTSINAEVGYPSQDKGDLRISVKVYTDKKDVAAQKRQIAPFVVHSFDGYLVRYLYQKVGYPLQTIHDSFATTPANTQKLYEDVRKAFEEIAQPENLLNILEQMLGDKELAKQKFDAMQIGDFHPKGQTTKNTHGFSAGVTNPDIGNMTDVAGQLEAEQAEGEITDATTVAKAALVAEESKPCK